MVDVEKFPSGGQWVPSSESGSDWLLLAIHGSGGSCRDFDGLDEIFAIPSLNYLYVNGPISDYNGYRWYSDMSYRQEAYDTLGLILDTMSREGYPPEKTFLLGFSQGAALAIEFAVRYPKLLAGYIAISGRVENLPGLFSQGNDKIIRQGEWLVTHGTRDYNLSIETTRQQIEQMRAGGFHIDFQEFDKIHEFEASRELPYIRDWIRDHMRN